MCPRRGRPLICIKEIKSALNSQAASSGVRIEGQSGIVSSFSRFDPLPDIAAQKALIGLCSAHNRLHFFVKYHHLESYDEFDVSDGGTVMAKSSKLIAAKRGRILLVRRKRDRIWMFPGGRRRGRETEKDCLRREIREELPKLKLGRLKLWKEIKTKNPRSRRKMSDAIFIANKVSGRLAIGDKKEIDKATWRKPRGIRLTPTSRYIRDKLFPKRG
jgi:8-oxo-dGTP diphosphatase